MKREFLDYVEDIIEAMETVESFVVGMSYEQFEQDLRTNYAVARALEIIGEATKQLPQSIRRKYDHIPWQRMAGMRDRIIHGYNQVDLEIVWDVVKKDIPRVKPQVEQILSDYKGPIE